MNNKLLYTIIVFSSLFILSNNAYSQCTDSPVKEAIINGDFEKGYIAAGPGSFTTVHQYAVPAVAPILAGLNPAYHWDTYPKFYIGPGKQNYQCNTTNYTDKSVFSPEVLVQDDHTPGMGGNGNFLMVDTRDGEALYGKQQSMCTVSRITFHHRLLT